MLKTWDIFCKIVDNYGDIGVCWRLAKRLQVEHGLQVRLWIDDFATAQKIIPSLICTHQQQVVENITILKWQRNADNGKNPHRHANIFKGLECKPRNHTSADESPEEILGTSSYSKPAQQNNQIKN